MIDIFRGVLALAASLWLSAAPASEAAFKSGGPYVPTPQIVVDRMLQFANVNDKDFVVDLGSGDGVIVLTAARQYKAGGMGIDIDADLVKLSNDRARQLNVADRVGFLEQDVFKADLSRATVVTLYLLPGMMLDLRPKIFNELKPGVRVVSHDYHFGEWHPDDKLTFDVPEKVKVNGVPKATVNLWYVPAKVAGTWQVKLAGGGTYELVLKQRFQEVEGDAIIAGKSVKPPLLTIKGDEIRFNVPDAKGIVRFNGRVEDNSMQGTAEVPGVASPASWSATRIAQGKVITE